MPITKEDYAALAGFRRALRQYFHFCEEAACSVGLTMAQHQVLLAIMGSPNPCEVTIGDIAEQLFIRHHSAVGLVDRLVSQNLVVRQTAAVDRRSVYVILTENGRHVLECLASAHRAELHRLSPQFQILLNNLSAGDLTTP